MAAAIAAAAIPAPATVSLGSPICENGFLKRHVPVVCDLVTNLHTRPYPWVLASLIVAYVTRQGEDCFGAEMWLRHYGADIVEPEPPLCPYAFYRFWFGRDIFEPDKQVCETHLPPVLRPRVITHIPTQISYHFSLNILGRLMENPLEGESSRYTYNDSEILVRHGKTKAGAACWLLMRKDVVARNEPWTAQIRVITVAGYEVPSALDVATIVETRRKCTGEHHLGDATGVENRPTYSRCRETGEVYGAAIQATVGGHAPLAVGGAGLLGGLRIDHGRDISNRIGVVALRQV